MSWEERIRPAAYTSPGGSRIEFAWESVSRDTPKRTASFDAVGFDGTYVQDNGHGGRTFPMRCLFSGPECDIEASWFEEALLERGTGRLEHPVYGDFDVVPSGSIGRRDDLVSGANVSVVEVTFLETTSAIFPTPQTFAPSVVADGVASMNEAAGLELAGSLSLDTVAKAVSVKSNVTAVLDRARGVLAPLTAGSASIRRAYDDADSMIRQSLDILVEDPVELARSVASLIELVGQTDELIANRLDTFEAFIDRTMTSPAGRPQDFITENAMPRRTSSIANAFRISDLAVLAALAGCASAASTATYRARPDAIATASRLLVLLGDVVAWRDAAYAALAARAPLTSRIDVGGAMQALDHAVSSAAGHLIDLSFTLRPERRIVLDRSRTILDLAAELYGTVDDALDLLIETNSLTGSEILELPAGRTVVYYPT